MSDCSETHKLYIDADWKYEAPDIICRDDQWFCRFCGNGTGFDGIGIKSKYNVGDILWVRETWAYVDFCGEDNGYVYRATDPDWETMDEWKWKPSIFMPREACRIELKVNEVRIERLQDITEKDCLHEGVEADKFLDLTARDNFQSLWDKINGNWDLNPFVWVIGFQKNGANV